MGLKDTLQKWFGTAKETATDLTEKVVEQMAARQPGSNIEPVGPDDRLTAMPRYLNNRAGSIYGGSNEVQRNVIGERVLGLPRSHSQPLPQRRKSPCLRTRRAPSNKTAKTARAGFNPSR